MIYYNKNNIIHENLPAESIFRKDMYHLDCNACISMTSDRRLGLADFR